MPLIKRSAGLPTRGPTNLPAVSCGCLPECQGTPTNEPEITDTPAGGCETYYATYYDTDYDDGAYDGSGDPSWTWNGAVIEDSELEIVCIEGRLWARITGAPSSRVAGASDANGGQNGYKDITDDVTCEGGVLTGSFTLEFEVVQIAGVWTTVNTCGFTHSITVTL